MQASSGVPAVATSTAIHACWSVMHEVPASHQSGTDSKSTIVCANGSHKSVYTCREAPCTVAHATGQSHMFSCNESIVVPNSNTRLTGSISQLHTNHTWQRLHGLAPQPWQVKPWGSFPLLFLACKSNHMPRNHTPEALVYRVFLTRFGNTHKLQHPLLEW